LEAAVRGTRIEDLDMAKAVSEMTRNRIREGLAIGSQRLAEGNRGRILDLLG
jgi:flagellin-like hook-associated protein FlgL